MASKKTPTKEIKKVPPKILNLLSEENTSLVISQICLLAGLQKEEIEKVAYQVARVLLGNLPPDLLAKALEEKEGVSSETALLIANEIDQRIFLQVRENLSELYGKERENLKEEMPKPEKPSLKEEKPSPPRDIYREPTK